MIVKIESHWAEVGNRADGRDDPTTWEGEVELKPDTPHFQLEQVFRLFNRVEQADVQRLRDIGYTLPSLSTGDHVTLDGVRWRCCAVGWKQAPS